MARHSYYADPSQKHLEVYYDFSGGLNTVTSNDNLGDNELTTLINMDLAERGSVKRRTGMTKHLTSPVTGKGQGYFRYFKDGGVTEEILAVNGKLYKNGIVLPITGLTDFQTTRQIEAAQLGNTLYIATGTKLVQYDGAVAKVVEPHAPDPLEALYVGTNALADDPDNYLSDGEAEFIRIDGVTVTMRYGVVNKPNTFEVFVSKPSPTAIIEYQYKWRKKGTTTWIVGQDFSISRTYAFTPRETGEYEFDFYARVQGETNVNNYAQYTLPSYKVNETDENEPVDSSTIHTCNRILLHWNRLIMYGDTTQTQAIHISHLNQGNFFPTPNSLMFENERSEPLTALVRFRNIIVAFTPTTVQALHGTSPLDFVRSVLNTNIGCIAPFSAQVMGNYITFLSREGLHILKNIGYTEDRLNVEKIDTNITNLIPQQENACAYSLDGQYRICFPTEKKQFRCYYNFRGMPWTSDESDKLTFARFYAYDGVLYGQSETDGHVLKYDGSVWTDDGHVYKDVVETKYFDFGQPYNPKKLKEFQIMLAHPDTNINSKIWLYADAATPLNPDASYALVNENGDVVWNLVETPNLEVLAGTVFGEWQLGRSPFGNTGSTVKKLRVSGKCRRTKIYMVHEEATYNQLLGLGYIFKVKKA